MDSDMKELLNMFNIIKSMGYVHSKRKGSTGVGYTFECLINKEEDSNPGPDFKSIEIKTMRFVSKQKVHLFNAAPDGDCDFPIKNVLDKLGYKKNDVKACYISVVANKMTSIGYYKRAILIVNYDKEKIYLKGYNPYGNELGLNVSWSFERLKEKINTKLKKMAIIKAQNKFLNNNELFYYDRITFYKLKSFNTFIKLIEEGIIKVTFKVKEQFDEHLENHGVDFSIEIKDIELLFDKIKN